MREVLEMREIFLKDLNDFIKIEGRYCGGYQDWLYTEKLRSKFWANRACGVVAAANTAYYLSVHHGLCIYNEKSLTVGDFTLFMNEIFELIRPLIFGIPTLSYMRLGFMRFVKSKGIYNLESKSLRNFKDKKRVVDFITSALELNYPVMMINWNSDVKRLRYHWVTIVGYVKDNTEYLVVSNWGQLEEICIDLVLKDSSVYKGLIYFKTR